MEKTYKTLQIMGLIIAILAPWIYFVGYAYDWGLLDTFAIERQIFFKAPPEYFGLAYVVLSTEVANLINSIPVNDLWPVWLFVAVSLVLGGWVIHDVINRKKIWPRLLLRIR